MTGDKLRSMVQFTVKECMKKEMNDVIEKLQRKINILLQ